MPNNIFSPLLLDLHVTAMAIILVMSPEPITLLGSVLNLDIISTFFSKFC